MNPRLGAQPRNDGGGADIIGAPGAVRPGGAQPQAERL